MVATETMPDWAESGAQEVAPGVHRIPLPMPGDGLRAVNVYAIDDGSGALTLIDGGWQVEEAHSALDEALSGIGRRIEDVGTILVTHSHRDHYTLAATIRNISGASVLLGRDELPTIEAIHDGWGLTLGPYVDRVVAAGGTELAEQIRELVAFDPPPTLRTVSPDIAFPPPDRWLDDGDRIAVGDRELVAISTPGHTSGHLVFRDGDSGPMFTGDHVLPHITPSIAFEPVVTGLPLGRFLDSLRVMLDLSDAEMLPSHGPAGGRVHARATELIAHHEQRLDEMMRALAASGQPLSGIGFAHAISWTRRGRALDELDLFNQMLAVNETMHHIDLLVDRGLVLPEEGAVTRYAINSDIGSAG